MAMMTDSDLNELLATKVMGWRKSELVGWPFYRDGNIDLMHYDEWNPCADYNHLRQVEEALSEEQQLAYAFEIDQHKLDCIIEVCIRAVIYATARQRCEAIAKVVSDV